tara:strand:+ start:53 stop:706 length:654 start_codon:yes stop_codon:yes gene_type:complete
MFQGYSASFLALLKLSHQTKEKNIILEPLCCIFRMIILNFKENGMKISIVNNSIQFNEPSFYQGIIRSYNGDTREDLHNLYEPFLKAFEWYPISKNGSLFRYFYQKAYEGLNKLLQSYNKGSIISHTLSHYCTLFRDIMNDNFNVLSNHEEESPLLENLKEIWKEEELLILYQMFQFIEKCDCNDEKQVYIQMIDEIISMKERKVYEYIQRSSTTYN